MTYGYTTLATNFDQDGKLPLIARLLCRVIPLANPDNEQKYPEVKKWLLELDDSGVPTREIGLDSAGNPLFGAPDERNYGFWTDNPGPFDSTKLDVSTQTEFEIHWEKTQKTEV